MHAPTGITGTGKELLFAAIIRTFMSFSFHGDR
jgi:hypothetical protein